MNTKNVRREINTMRDIPDFDVELSQSISYVLESDLARKALKHPPFDNFTNIIICLIKNIDRLADNCHMPEFTNHAMPHICSIVKRASEWSYYDNWINNISSEEAAYLLIALLIHDMGMLSQESIDLPDDKRIVSMKGFSDISNWVRVTHVERLPKLVKRLLSIFLEEDENLNEHLEIAIMIACSHDKWPWDKAFVNNVLLESERLNKQHIRALNSIVAVSDLLDEDSNRCDTVTLIQHRHGSSKNIAHWIRHALTAFVDGVKNRQVVVTFRRLPEIPEDFEMVYRALRNHYKLIRFYNNDLKIIGADINEIIFNPPMGIPSLYDDVSEQMKVWKYNLEFLNSLTQQLLDTFMIEALNEDRKNPESRKAMNIAGLELMDGNIISKVLYPNQLVTDEERVFINNYLSDEVIGYMHKKAEAAYLNGEIGSVCHICISVLESITQPIMLDKVYWCISYMLTCEKTSADYIISVQKYENTLFNPFHDNKYIKGQNSAYRGLVDVLVLLQEPRVSEKYLVQYKEHILSIGVEGIENSLATDILIQTVVGFFWYYNHEGNEWLDLCDYFLLEFKERNMSIQHSLELFKNRLLLQEQILYGSINNITIENKLVFVKAWAYFYKADWAKVKPCIPEMISFAKRDSDFFCSVQGYINITEWTLKTELGNIEDEYDNKIYTKRYRYQRASIENPLAAFWKIRKKELESLCNECSNEGEEVASKRTDFLRLLILQQLDALKYWDLGEYIDSVVNETNYHVSTSLYHDKYGNYCGVREELVDAVISSIRSLNEKTISKDKKKVIVKTLENVYPEGVYKVFNYILTKASKQEWFICNNWLNELIPSLVIVENINIYKDIIIWILQYYRYSQQQHHHYNLGEYKYLVHIINQYKLDNDEWIILDEVIDFIFRNINILQINYDLGEILLCNMPKDMTLKYLDRIFKFDESKQKENVVIGLSLSLSYIRNDIIEEIKLLFLKMGKEYPESSYIRKVDLIGIRFLKDIKENHTNELKTELNKKIRDLMKKENIHGYNSRYFSDLQNDFANENWLLANEDELKEIIDMIWDFLEEYQKELTNLYMYDFFTLLNYICKTAEKSITTAILSKIIYTYIQHDIEIGNKNKQELQDGPLNSVHIDIGEKGAYERGLFLIMSNNVYVISDEINQRIVLFWAIDKLDIYETVEFYYATVLFIYFYFKGKKSIRPIAFGGLLMIKGIVSSQHKKRDVQLHNVINAISSLMSADKFFARKTMISYIEEDEEFKKLFYDDVIKLSLQCPDTEVRKMVRDNFNLNKK